MPRAAPISLAAFRQEQLERQQREDFKRQEAEAAEALRQAEYAAEDAVRYALDDGNAPFPGVVIDPTYWMPRASLAALYFEHVPESPLSAHQLYEVLYDYLRESKIRGTRGLYGLRPETVQATDSALPEDAAKSRLRTITLLRQDGFLDRLVIGDDAGWITRSDLRVELAAWSATTGNRVRLADFFAALPTVPGVRPAKRRGVRGFRGLALAA